MPADFLAQSLAVPIVIGVLALVAIALVPSPKAKSGFIGLGRKRIALGAIGALTGILLATLYHAAVFNIDGRSVDDLIGIAFWHQVLAHVLYLFILSAPFAAIYVLIICLPLLALLKRIKHFSIQALAVTGLALSIIVGIWLTFLSGGTWCEQNRLNCFVDGLLGAGIPILIIHIGFGLFSKMPLRSVRESEN